MDTTDKNSKPTLSRKQKIKALFEAQGAEAAHVLGMKLKLKPSTLRTWCSTWRREGVKATPKKKAKVKAVKTANKVITEPMSKPVNGQEGNVATS